MEGQTGNLYLSMIHFITVTSQPINLKAVGSNSYTAFLSSHIL
jgi:hypothetical protein